MPVDTEVRYLLTAKPSVQRHGGTGERGEIREVSVAEGRIRVVMVRLRG